MKSALILALVCATIHLVPCQAQVNFQLRQNGSAATTATVGPGGTLALDVVAVSISAEAGIQANLDSFTYRLVFPNPSFTLQSSVFAVPFDNALVPAGFNGSIPWAPPAVLINPSADAGSPGSPPGVSDLYRTTATTTGVPVVGPDAVLETLTLQAPVAPGNYAISLNVLEAADRDGALHITGNGTPFMLTVGGPCSPDSTPPVIALNGPNPLTLECHTAFADPGATATDNCPVPGTVVAVTSAGTVDGNTPGSYTITYSATDPSGNTASATRTVKVADTLAPVITLNGANPLAVACHTPFTDPGATATDACAGSVAVSVSGSVDVNTSGNYTLTYTAMDPTGNTATATRTVTVGNCGTALALTCPSDMTVANDADDCSAVVSYSAPVASGGASPYTITCSPLSGSVFALGATTVNCTVTDAAAHTATCSFKVTVNDTEPPVITCPTDLSVPCLSDVPPPTFTGSVTDNCDSSPVVTHVGDVPVGTHPIHITRTFKATDASGNADTCAQIITVLGLVGDLNADCCVDRTDLDLLMAQIRAGSADLTYDLNGDGKVDIADARFLVLHFTNPGGAPCP